MIAQGEVELGLDLASQKLAHARDTRVFPGLFPSLPRACDSDDTATRHPIHWLPQLFTNSG
jgi:hypothetical protein